MPNSNYSFLPLIENIPGCTGCINQGSCLSDHLKYCNKRSFEPVVFENFEWNRCGVCVNPLSIIVNTRDKRVFGAIHIAKYKDDLYRLSISGNGVNEGFAGLPFIHDTHTFADKNEALEAGKKAIMHRLSEYLNNIK